MDDQRDYAEEQVNRTLLREGHADYPHTPGTLYDCKQCEHWCHCEELNGVQCVHCALRGVTA